MPGDLVSIADIGISMKGISMRTMLVFVIVGWLTALAMAGDLVITPMQDDSLTNLPVLKWVADGDHDWGQSDPLFTLSDSKSGTSAKGWVVANEQNIYLRVIVSDDLHINDKSDGNIWEGDCIQVGLDAKGNGKPGSAKDGDDADMAFALTSHGIVSWAYHHGRPGSLGRMSNLQSSIVRDENAGTTTYDITLPWSEFQTQPGLSPVLGITVQINDTDKGAGQTRVSFGHGVGGRPQPGLYRKLKVGTPLAPILAAKIEQQTLWRMGDSGEILLAVCDQPDVTIRASMGEAQAELALTSQETSSTMKRFVIRGTPRPLPSGPLTIDVSVIDKQGKVLLSQSSTFMTGVQVVGNLNQRIDALAVDSPHPLFTRHLSSVKALLNIEWQLAQWNLDDSTVLAENVMKVADLIGNGLDGDAGDWRTYLQRRRKLVLGFMAPSDRTLQYYMVTLPMNWDPGKTYPMIVFLHGAGTSHVATEVVGSLFSGQERKPATARFDGDFDALYIEPYARGRHGYREIAEKDVMLAVADAVRTFKVDPDRMYLTGFSMGGAGTWAVAAHRPDLWAAVCINAGSARYIPTGIGIGRNYLGLPVRIWHGDADPAMRVQYAFNMAEELRAYGVEPELIIKPGVGHDYYDQPQESENLAWLMTHTRQRPAHFGFTAHTDEYPGRNGVTLLRDPAASFNPWFECRIEGHTVRLTSEGSPELTVQLGDGGLGFTTDVTVFLGEQKVYEGPAVTIRINTADGSVAEGRSRRGRRG